MIYLDNAATSWPKPEGVAARMTYYLEHVGASINRASYAAAQEVGLVTLSLRERLCRLLGFDDPTHVVLTSGATAGLNLVLKGLLKPGDRCLVSSMEHNAVMRPLAQLRKTGVQVEQIPCDREGRLDLQALSAMLERPARLVAVNHGSNVCGTVQDAQAIGRLCAGRGVPLLLDAAQTAGHCKVDFKAFSLSTLVVPAHKGLLGPSGMGAVLLTPELAAQLDPLIAGGTGSASDSEEMPAWMPDRFEAGTPNLPGIYGWEEALRVVEEAAVRMQAHDRMLTLQFLDGLAGMDHVRPLGLCNTFDLRNLLHPRVGVIGLDFLHMDNAEAAFRLEQEFGILTRCGLHCAPAAHRTLGTYPQGCVRFSLGYYNSEKDVDEALRAVRALAKAPGS